MKHGPFYRCVLHVRRVQDETKGLGSSALGEEFSAASDVLEGAKVDEYALGRAQ